MSNMKALHYKLVHLLLFLVVSKSATASPIPQEKCSLENEDCLKRAAQASLPTFVQGIPELGIKSLDILHMEDLNVELPDVQYRLWNTEVNGFNDTIIDGLSINLPLKLMRLDFHSTLLINSDYQINGELFGVPVDGEGKVAFIMKKFQMELVILFDIVKNDQDQDIMDIKSYFYGSDALDGLHTYLSNLYSGDKKKSDDLHEILNTNWRTVVSNFGRYFTAQLSKEVFENIQIFMRSRPLEDLAVY